MLQIKNLSKAYKTKGGVVTRALDDVSVDFPEKGLVFLLGKSGSGKSTLLNMIGGLDRPDSGEVIVRGRSSKDFSQSDFDSYRNTYVGFIFQEYNVLNEFNIEQNIALALQLQGKKNDKAAVDALLKEVDLEGFNKRKPNTLSGGQKQRIAIARALIKDPEIIMADEPTGALDSNTGKQVLEILKKLSQTKLVIIVSHDQDFAEEYGDRIIELKDGKIISDKTKEYVAPKSLNENVTVVNENVIDIKDADKLSEADFKEIYKLIKKQKGEVLISSGEKTVTATKKAAKVNEGNHSEVFTDTTKIDMKEYNGSETKFIRSRMPFARAFKMGASSLKTKPIRLIFTILLSVVSMTLFGAASTLMFYKPSYTLATAMQQSDRTSEAIVKKFNYSYRYETINNQTGEVSEEGNSWDSTEATYFGKSELEELNNANNNKFIGVYSVNPGVQYYSLFAFYNARSREESADYFLTAEKGFDGVSDASESWMNANGFSIYGKAPTETNEIAVSNYFYDFFADSDSLGEVNSKEDLLGKTIEFKTAGYGMPTSLTISGIYDFGPIPSTYDSLKKEKPASQNNKDREQEIDGLSRFLRQTVYTTGFVSPSFFDKFAKLSENRRGYVNDEVYPNGIRLCRSKSEAENTTINSDEGYEPVTIYDDLKEGTYEIYDSRFKKIDIPEFGDGDILLPYSGYYEEFQNYQYYGQFEEIISLLNGAFNCRDDGFQDFMNDYYSSEKTTELGKALERLVASLRNENYYPEGFNREDDREFVSSELGGFFKKTLKFKYLQEVVNLLSVRDDLPADWSNDTNVNLRNRLSGWTITDSEFTQLANYCSEIVSNNSACSYIPAVVFVRNILLEVALQSNMGSMSVDNVSKKLGYDDDYWSIFNDAETSGYSAQSVEKIKEFGKELFIEVYGKAIDDSALTTVMGGMDDLNMPSSVYVPKTIYSTDYRGKMKEFTVKGFFKNRFGGGYSRSYCLTRAAIYDYLKDSYSWRNVTSTDYVAPADERYSYLIAVTNYSQDDISLLTSKHGSYEYQMTNDIYVTVSFFTEMIGTLKNIFLAIGAVTGVLAGLLLLNFISVSIASKNKDIGILRAVGARGSDVFKIFYSESSIITLICFVLSVIASMVVCFFINQQTLDSALSVALLDFGPINVLVILGVGLIFSFIATFIPVMITAKKPPVEAIRAL